MFTNEKWIFGAITFVVGVSLWGSIFTGDWHWFARSGGIVTFLGGLLAARRIIRLGVEQIYSMETEGDTAPLNETPEFIESLRQLKLDVRATHRGCVLVTIGTIIWAYGDLL